ncbi:MAG TPA: DUF1802 domain-containing protein [Cyanobacteria bacterium UBA11369]|nr:DUF1802 domain-containing protein [Cyanobacteria bacterium UBA11371]HBE32445.1 DUF1802 domain-containing protein [Cyanobacteria bacterium UBA11368]HBE52079.1 DUF1802 domain-containing protein [Cyanobacteria bacterium UBA11369]
MGKLVSIETALPLPAPDIEALIQGRMLAAIPRRWLDQGKQFALYPTDLLINSLQPEFCYKDNFWPIAKTVISNLNAEKVTIKAWARCELCQMLDSSESLKAVSQLTVWKTEALEQILSQFPYIFLAHLRVYLLSQPIEIPVHPNARDKKGKFIPLPQRLMVSDSSPVLSDRIFTHRRHQLENRLPPPHPELEELQAAVAQLNTPAAKQLNEQIQIFLGWKKTENNRKNNPDLDWIKTITSLGDRSKELDQGKSNYQAGTDFENIIKRSLEFLGFTVDYFHKGGAGGVDVFCEQPYPLVCECKAGKKIPNQTAVQLLNLGTLRLKSKELFQQAAKLIIGPGEPTAQLKEAAKVHNMTIINPETIEALVNLQNKYRNSVDLFKLKEYLKPGQSRDEIQKYIELVEQEIKLRSQIVQAVHQLANQEENLDNPQKSFSVTEIRVHYNATQNPKLTDQIVRDLLVELSSPLTGYLGRNKGSDSLSDRFYFLRHLTVD